MIAARRMISIRDSPSSRTSNAASSLVVGVEDRDPARLRRLLQGGAKGQVDRDLERVAGRRLELQITALGGRPSTRIRLGLHPADLEELEPLRVDRDLDRLVEAAGSR